jgi:hypothetical protein
MKLEAYIVIAVICIGLCFGAFSFATASINEDGKITQLQEQTQTIAYAAQTYRVQ